MEQVRGEDGWSEETQEDETAHRCVTDVLVHCVEKKGVHIIVISGSILAGISRIHEGYSEVEIQIQCCPKQTLLFNGSTLYHPTGGIIVYDNGELTV